MTLDKKSYVPMSRQIAAIICERIIQHQYVTGESLPSQQEFAQEFGVSMITIRHAFAELSREGVIQSLRGKGSFVLMVPQLQYRGYHTASGYTADSKFLVKSLSTKVLEIKNDFFYPEAAAIFDSSATVTLINRLRIIDEVAASLEFSYLNPKLLPKIDWQTEIKNNASLYEFIEKKFSQTIGKSEEKIIAVVPAANIQTLLELGEAEPVLFIKRQTWFEKSNLPFEYCEYYIRSEYFGRIIYNAKKTISKSMSITD